MHQILIDTNKMLNVIFSIPTNLYAGGVGGGTSAGGGGNTLMSMNPAHTQVASENKSNDG